MKIYGKPRCDWSRCNFAVNRDTRFVKMIMGGLVTIGRICRGCLVRTRYWLLRLEVAILISLPRD